MVFDVHFYVYVSISISPLFGTSHFVWFEVNPTQRTTCERCCRLFDIISSNSLILSSCDQRSIPLSELCVCVYVHDHGPLGDWLWWFTWVYVLYMNISYNTYFLFRQLTFFPSLLSFPPSSIQMVKKGCLVEVWMHGSLMVLLSGDSRCRRVLLRWMEGGRRKEKEEETWCELWMVGIYIRLSDAASLAYI